MDKETTRDLILEAVTTCIEKYGIDHLTTRKIAEEAGTNIASINYYFRSKEQLVAEALTMTIQHMLQDVNAAIQNEELPFEQALEEVFFYLLDGGLRFPGITTAHLYAAVVEKSYDSPGARGIRGVFDALSQRAIQELAGKDPEKVRYLLSQTTASIMFTLLAPDFFSLAPQYQPSVTENRRRLAKELTRSFLELVDS